MAADCDGKMIYPAEPPGFWSSEDVRNLLLWAIEMGASDVRLLPGHPVGIRQHGRWLRVSLRNLTPEEVAATLDDLARSHQASAIVLGGEAYDFSVDVQGQLREKHRFRGNATGCRAGTRDGINIVLRSIPSRPPSIDDLDLGEEIRSACFPDNGLVLITGKVGSGKTTTLAAMLRWILENQERHVITYEHPIEFDLQQIDAPRGFVGQSEIRKHLRAFSDAPPNAARRAPDVILLGEARDKETLQGMLTLAEQGPAVYATVHTASVAGSAQRIINEFDQAERPGMWATMISRLRLIIHQRLVAKIGGGRIALREYLAFTPDIEKELRGCPVEGIVPGVEHFVQTQGQPLLRDAEEKCAAGLISEQVLNQIRKEKVDGSL